MSKINPKLKITVPKIPKSVADVLTDQKTCQGILKSKTRKRKITFESIKSKALKLMKVDRPKPNTFLVRGLQWTTVIERMFNAENAKLRDEWIDAIKKVSDDLKKQDH
uniref:PH domain-containing protein n=1 Tax=Panagrolaimus sp. JU765 TaxID=591449 RepID=A0AC34RMC3_9BILA